ncbi:MAG: septal ring lytic transglycosylase RlpA family protein [Hellea sp.]|nr:septal ring lytic transglycosylase RlpA family protein [Hellea sp.]
MKIGKPYKVAGQSYTPKHNPDYDKIGVASWYGDKFHGKPTANGEAYDKNALTAAHKTLPLNSYVYVTNLETGKSLKVRLNDRGPFIDGRIIDLSEAAAGALGIRGEGLGRVRVQYAGAAPTTDAGKPFKPAKPAQIAERAAPSKHPEAQTPKSFEPKSPLSAPVQPVYRPLRDGGTSPSYVAQQNQEIFQVPNISGEVDQSPSIALPQSRSADAYDMPPIPQPIDENVEEGVVTLTIKGPVHMANIKTKKEKVELIPASYNGEK